jgi:hypothetical protein
VAGLISGLGGGFIPSRLRRKFVLEISCLHLLLHFLGKAVPNDSDFAYQVFSKRSITS